MIEMRVLRGISISMLISMLFCSPITAAQVKRSVFDCGKRIVVLDPGHGGRDKGSRGASGIDEKTVTLDLARMIAAELENRFEIILTRTDDYWLDPAGRTNMANHLKADLFISLHAGGSFLHQAAGMALFYFKPAWAADSETAKPIPGDGLPVEWENIQKRHSESSKSLASLVHNCLLEQRKNLKSEIKGAPIEVLKGADMPAILIELGYLTNPADEKALCESDARSALVKGIACAIDDFFKKAPPVSFINLRQ
jgi:N-acetylmuramoyl-L-alanine amidase